MEEADAERLELRLLTDPAFGEEFDTIVDELTDEYVGNEIQGEERKHVEQYFLKSTERQNKARFASELLERAALERGRPVAVPVAPVHAGILERARMFWASQTFFARFASSFASIVIVVGIGLLAMPGNRPSGTYAQANLTISSGDRSAGTQALPVKLEPGSPGIQIKLNLPDQIPPAKSYRVELVDGEEISTNLPIDQQTDRTLVVTVPADQIERGMYMFICLLSIPMVTSSAFRGVISSLWNNLDVEYNPRRFRSTKQSTTQYQRIFAPSLTRLSSWAL